MWVHTFDGRFQVRPVQLLVRRDVRDDLEHVPLRPFLPHARL
jgi:hypothetical protein